MLPNEGAIPPVNPKLNSVIAPFGATRPTAFVAPGSAKYMSPSGPARDPKRFGADVQAGGKVCDHTGWRYFPDRRGSSLISVNHMLPSAPDAIPTGSSPAVNPVIELGGSPHSGLSPRWPLCYLYP